MFVKVIETLEANKNDLSTHKNINVKDLKKVNNYFEFVQNQPNRIFIDVDGRLTQETIDEYDEDDFNNLHNRIKKALLKIDNVCIMESSSYKSNKLSYRITYINEYCDDLQTMKDVVYNEKYFEIENLLKKIIPLTIKKDELIDSLNVDSTVYREGKMRCVNAYKTNDDKTRINKLVRGDIEDTIISNIPDGAIKREKIIKEDEKIEIKTQIKTIKEDVNAIDNALEKENENKDILADIKNKVLKIGKPHFDSYNDWLELCFIINNESNNSYQGKELFLELCEAVCSNFNKEECEKKWYSVNPKASKKIKIGTLYKKYYDKFPEAIQKKLTIHDNALYKVEKLKFEKRIFRLDNPFTYVKINTDNSIEFLDDNKLTKYAKGEVKNIEIETKNENGEIKSKTYKFVDLWLEDTNKRQYDKIVFDPTTTEDKINYNCWTGYKHEIKPSTLNENDSLFLKLLKRICNNDIINYEYVKQWIAHIIQKPYLKTGIAIVLYSNTKGIGKNCIIDGLIKLLEGYTAKIESIEDITKNFNSHLINKLLIQGDEICAKAKNVADKLKEVITRTKQNLEKKRIDAIEVSDFTNWIFTTNNFDAFYIEKDDRRMNMIHCIEEKFKDSVEYYKEINDDNKMNELFNYLLTYKLTYKFGEGELPPTTKYKTQLQYNSKEGYIQMLYKQPETFISNSFTPLEFLNITNDYCKTHYLRQTTDIITFGKNIGSIFNAYKKRSKTSYIYNFSNITELQFNKLLYDYDKNYFKYVNNLEENEEPDFTEPLLKPKVSSSLDYGVNRD